LKDVLAETRGIGRVGEQVIVLAGPRRNPIQGRNGFCKQIQVEQQFFLRAFRVAPPAMERVLPSFFGPREIEIAAEFIGNGKIRLQDATQHFLIELLLECFRGLQNDIGISVLGF